MFTDSVGDREFTIDNSDIAFAVALGAVVAMNGRDFRYIPEGNGETCLYVHKNENGDLCNGCLIGSALIYMGVPAEWFLNRNSGRATEVMDELDFSYEVRSAANEAQSIQDTRATWGSALDEFINYYNL